MLNKNNIAWFRRLCKERKAFESVLVGSAVLFEMLNKIESANVMFDEAVSIGLRRGYVPFLGGLAVLMRLDDDLECAQNSIHLPALRYSLAVSILFNVILLAVVLAAIGSK